MKQFFIVGFVLISSLGQAQFRDEPELFIAAQGVVGSEQNSSTCGFSGGCVHYGCAVFYDPSKGLMRWEYWDPFIDSLDTVCTRGSYISIWQAKYSSSDAIHSACYDSLNGDLIYGKITGIWDSAFVEITRVDSINDVGRYTSIVTPWWSDLPIYITYYDVTNGDLKLAYSQNG